MSRLRSLPVLTSFIAAALLCALWALWMLSSALLLRSSILRMGESGITAESAESHYRGMGSLPSAHAPLEWLSARYPTISALVSASSPRSIFGEGRLDMGSISALSERERGRLSDFLSGEVSSSVLEAMRDAAACRAAHFERDFSRGPATDPGPMPSVASLSRMMAVLSLLSLDPAASRSPAEILSLCSSLSKFGINDPILMGWLSGASMDETAIESAGVAISSHTPAHFEESSWEPLASTWAARDAQAAVTLVAALETELLQSVEWVYRGLASGAVGSDDLGSVFGEGPWLPLVVAYRTVLLPWAMRDMSAHIDYMLGLREFIMSPERHSATPPSPPAKWYPLASRMAPWFEGLSDRLLSYRARLRLGRVGLALEAHRSHLGAYPRSLGELRLPESVLIDPFTGTPFLYRSSSAGVLVYSVGANGSDERGRERMKGRGDIAWRVGKPPPQSSTTPSAVSSVK